jgi:bifunctional non-homologous end joining protein LigD
VTGRRFEPMLASPWPAPFSDPGWLFEVKWDGVRVILNWTGNSLILQSRSGRDVTATYPEMSTLARPAACVLDGEMVAFDSTGRPSFSALQKRLGIAGGMKAIEAARLAPISYVVFDLLFDGEDVTRRPIEERLERLRALDLPGPVVASEVIEEHGEALFSAVVERELEGIVAKRHGSPYRPGVRSPDWRKIPHVRVVRAVVGGFTVGEGGRAGTFGSLALGLWEGTRLRWIGSVGTGFADSALLAIRSALDEMTVAESPFWPDPELSIGLTWVAPHLVARVEFKEWTEAGRLRAPSFKGFIAEEPEQVTWESEGPGK